MKLAIEQAVKAFAVNEVPVGAVLVHAKTKKIIASAHNLTLHNNDPTAHAEILVIRQACALLTSDRLPDYDLFVTLEPCAMCATAIAFARIRRLYFGAYDVKGGAVESGIRIFSQPTCHHTPEIIGGIYESDCGKLLKDFFGTKRKA
jgi:tRNA(Arg) A34 adenosine deaminase TadA